MIHVAHMFSFLCCMCVVFVRPVSFMPNVASVSGLSVFDFPYGFFNVYLQNIDVGQI